MAKDSVSAGVQRRTSTFTAPSSWDLATRSFIATAFTDTPVFMPYDGGWYEVLSMDPAHVDLSRYIAGSPLLDAHRTGSTDSQIGGVNSPVLRGRQLDVTAQISANEKHNDLVNDIDQGLVKNLSGGYNVYEYTDVTKEGDRYRTLMATKWQPFELSILPMGHDPKARIRSMPDLEEFQHVIPIKMNEEQIAAAAAAAAANPAPAAPAPAAPVAVGERALPVVGANVPVDNGAVVRQRAIAIANIAEMAGWSPAVIAEHIGSAEDIVAIQTRALKELSGKGVTQINQTGAPAAGTLQKAGVITVSADEIVKKRELVEIGIMRKLGLEDKKNPYTQDQIALTENYRQMPILGIAADYIYEATGDVSAFRMNGMNLAKRALISTNSADFPVILEGTARRQLMADYATVADKWRQFCVVGSVSDFREWARVRGGTIGDLQTLSENGEIKYGSLPDGAQEKVSVTTRALMITLTRKMLVNDDLGQFVKIVGQLGRSAARGIEKDVWGLFAKNPLMADGFNWISAEHNNIGISSAYGDAALDDMLLKLSQQTDLSGNDYLDYSPDRIVGPKSMETTLLKLNINEYESGSGKQTQQNIRKGLFQTIITSPRLTGTATYAFVNPAEEGAIEVNFLNGQQTPTIEERNEFAQDGMAIRIIHDWGVAPIGYKGVFKMPGA